MIYPKSLEKGFKVGITATSDGYEAEVDLIRLESGMKHFINLGYPVIETDNVRKSYKGRSSDGQTRAKELMQLFTNSEIRTIFAAAGGEFLMEMLPYLDLDILKENPKWVQGYSDSTGLTFTLTTNLDIATIYSNNFSSFGMEHWHTSLIDNIKILEGQDIRQQSFDKYQDGFKEKTTGLEEFVLEKDVLWKNIHPAKQKNSKKLNQWGEQKCSSVDANELLLPNEEINMSGRALGGCLDVLLNLVGTRFDKTKEFIKKYQQDGILWYLESFCLNSEALIRGLWQLKEAGWFQYASGFIFGRPAMFCEDNDITYEEAVLSVLEEFDLPIILEVDIGHKPPQIAMMNGAIAHIQSRGGKGSISFERR